MADQDIKAQLKATGVKLPRKRMAIAQLILSKGDCHLTADNVMKLCQEADLKVSLATVYNALNQFADAGLVKPIAMGGGRTFFDTNTTDHQHLYFEDRQELEDLPAHSIHIAGLPEIGSGYEISEIDLMIRVRKSD